MSGKPCGRWGAGGGQTAPCSCSFPVPGSFVRSRIKICDHTNQPASTLTISSTSLSAQRNICRWLKGRPKNKPLGSNATRSWSSDTPAAERPWRLCDGAGRGWGGGQGMCHSSVQKLEGRAIAEKRVTWASESQAARIIF